MNTAALDLSILGPAFLAGLLVLQHTYRWNPGVVARDRLHRPGDRASRCIGVIAADAAGWEPQGWAVQVVAVAAALAGALLLTYTKDAGPTCRRP